MSEALQGEAVLKTLLLSDLVSSTRLVAKLGDRRTAELFARHDELARELLVRHNGLEIDKSDGFFLIFDRPLCAVRYALAYHEALAGLGAEMGVDLAARVGIHLGEVFLRTNPPEHVARGAKPIEVEGLAKPITARLMSLAIARQTLLTRGAFELARRAAVDRTVPGEKACWLAHGAYRIQGLRIPVKIFEVGIEGFAPLAPPGESDKARLAWGEATTPKSPLAPIYSTESSLTQQRPALAHQIAQAVETAAHQKAVQERYSHRYRNRLIALVAALLFLAAMAFQEHRVRLQAARADHEAERAHRAEETTDRLMRILESSPKAQSADAAPAVNSRQGTI